MQALVGGLIPLIRWEHEHYRQHSRGGEQTRSIEVTWLRRTWRLDYTSKWHF